MAQIPQFSQAEIHNLVPAPAEKPAALDVLMFNMERGVHLDELGDFLTTCPDVLPYDVILANELDDGCVRSAGKDTTAELANRLGMNYVFGLEFIELVNGEDPKGHHGNAIFSRWPIVRAKIVRLPEQEKFVSMVEGARLLKLEDAKHEIYGGHDDVLRRYLEAVFAFLDEGQA